MASYDAVLIVSFGGPEKPEDVLPFLENVLRGKNVPRERMLEVAEHYHHFGGVSPINGQNRLLIQALAAELAHRGPQLPIYWGNRNWHPLLPEAFAQMARDGVRRAIGFFTSAYSSYSGCRQYWENIAAAQSQLGPAAPQIDKVARFFDHPRFVRAQADRLQAALEQIPTERRDRTPIVFTAHSIPQSMADHCEYVSQLRETARLVTASLGLPDGQLVYQSRSGPPNQPWLEPDICEHARRIHAAGARDVVVAPIGFLSDHMEVLFDLDTELKLVCEQLGLNLVRALTVGTHPEFVGMIRDLIAERVAAPPESSLTAPSCIPCRPDCCPAPQRPRPAPPN